LQGTWNTQRYRQRERERARERETERDRVEELEEEYVRGHEKYYTFYWDNRKNTMDVKTSRHCPLVLPLKVRLEASLRSG